jgi:hypothetical protein
MAGSDAAEALSVSFEGSLTRDEFRRAQRLYRRYGGTIDGIAVMFVAAGLYGAWRSAGDQSAMFLVFVLLAVWGGVLFAMPRRQTEALWRAWEKRSISLGGIADGSGLLLRTGGFETRVPWSEFEAWRGDASMIVLMQGNRQFSAYPRSFFASEGEWERFRELVARSVTAG